MKGLHGIIFSYEKHNNLRELTANRMPASVPFAGRYRIIDFILSSMVNAGITDVGIVLHGRYQSLLDHLGSGKDWDLSRKYGGLRLLPPFAYEQQSGYIREFRGRMEALAGVRSYLQGIRQSHVVLANSDLIINIPLQDVYQAHLASGADITAVCTSNLDADAEDINYFRLNDQGRITETLYSVRNPEGCYRSLEIYILSKQLLLELVDECISHNLFNFRSAVLQGKADSLHIQSYVWDGYAAQIHSVKEYYDRSVELLDPAIRREVFHPQRPVHTKDRNDASTYIDPDGSCCNSLVADGCTIEGTVENSILFRGVSVARGAEVKNCVLMQDVSVGRDAVLHYVVADKNVEIMESRTLMGHDAYPLAIAKNSKV